MSKSESAHKLFARNLNIESLLGDHNNHKIEIWGNILQDELVSILYPIIQTTGQDMF